MNNTLQQLQTLRLTGMAEALSQQMTNPTLMKNRASGNDVTAGQQ